MPVKEGKWKDACATVGELVLLHTALDHQLNIIIIEVMHLTPSPMLEPVVSTLDPRQKIEMSGGAGQTAGLEESYQNTCGPTRARSQNQKRGLSYVDGSKQRR
jgi:hypothetical protein